MLFKLISWRKINYQKTNLMVFKIDHSKVVAISDVFLCIIRSCSCIDLPFHVGKPSKALRDLVIEPWSKLVVTVAIVANPKNPGVRII